MAAVAVSGQGDEVMGGPVGRLAGLLRACNDELAAVDADTLTVGEVGALLEVLETERNRQDGARARLAASFARREGHRRSGHKSLAHWMSDRLRRSPGAARKEARTAQGLARLPATAAALGDGDISLEHAAEIEQAARELDDPEGAQRSLLAEARSGDPRAVRRAGQRLRRDADRRAEADRASVRARQQRTVSFRADQTAKTMWFEGRLPLVEGAGVRAAVEALAVKGDDDERSYVQRMADGLVELAARADSGAGLPAQRGVPVELMVVCGLDTLAGRAGAPPATLTGVGELSDLELNRLVAKADLSWLIVDAAGVPLRYGKTRRFASTDQRRVLRARDGGCCWPACDAPAVWTLAHHEPPFDEPGGATDLDTQALICDVHHHLRHHLGWTVELDAEGTVTVTSPDGATVLTETAAQVRARHNTYELATTSSQTAHGTDTAPRQTGPAAAPGQLFACETPAAYEPTPRRARRGPGRTASTPRTARARASPSRASP